MNQEITWKELLKKNRQLKRKIKRNKDWIHPRKMDYLLRKVKSIREEIKQKQKEDRKQRILQPFRSRIKLKLWRELDELCKNN